MSSFQSECIGQRDSNNRKWHACCPILNMSVSGMSTILSLTHSPIKWLHCLVFPNWLHWTAWLPKRQSTPSLPHPKMSSTRASMIFSPTHSTLTRLHCSLMPEWMYLSALQPTSQTTCSVPHRWTHSQWSINDLMSYMVENQRAALSARAKVNVFVTGVTTPI